MDAIEGFPPDLKALIKHLLISHHGQYEFGSPKLPMFPEALMLHYMDDLDSKMESMRAQFEREAEFDSPWASYNPSLARPLLNTKKFLAKGLAASRIVETPKPAAGEGVAPVVPEEISSAEESNGNGPKADTPDAAPAAAAVASEKPALSPLEALEKKFAAHKVTSKPS
jgi:hypothetical protein